MTGNILIVEDEPAISEMLKFSLSQAGYHCVVVEDAEQAQTELFESIPDIVLLDWMLPGMSGIELANYMKKNDATAKVPIIMLTARGEEKDKILGLSSGVDDYITKPFSKRELLARIKAVLRRTAPHTVGDVIEINGLRLDIAAHRVIVQDKCIDIGPKEYQLLLFFMSHPERVYSRIQLLNRVWGSNVYVEERTVDVHVRRLRKALSEYHYDRFIQTVRGSGYRFSTKP